MTKKTTFKVIFLPQGVEINVASGHSVLDAAREAGISLSAACNGKAYCGQCRVRVQKGQTQEPGEAERNILTEEEISQGQRLACRTLIQSPMTIYLPPSHFLNEAELQYESPDFSGALEPGVTQLKVKLSPPSLDDSRADFKRLADDLPETEKGYFADSVTLNQLSRKARSSHWEFSVLLKDNEIIGVLPLGAIPVGLAVDLGTTKIAASLIDFSSGKEITRGGVVNPQIRFGEDLISRLEYAIQSRDKAEEMTRVARQGLDQLAESLILQAGLRTEQLTKILIAGNTAMTHLFCALPVAQLAVAPFVAATSDAMEIKARDVGLKAAPGAYVYFPPNIGGFIGSDHLSMVLASNIDLADDLTLGIDIGTNTEIVLSRALGQMENASCASGPAFEGYHITCGMRAFAGAISAARLTPEGFRFTTIKDAPALGICGTAIIDIVAELRRNSIINQGGRMDPTHPMVRQGRTGPELLLVDKAQSGNQRDIIITQEDINQVQLAKGAIRAGIEILLKSGNIELHQVKKVIFAGAFGSYINLSNAMAMGLIPHFPHARYFQSGNAALSGAKALLLSKSLCQRIKQITSHAHYRELSTYKEFNRLFAMGMFFLEEDLIKAHQSDFRLEDMNNFIKPNQSAYKESEERKKNENNRGEN
ncbi:MAG: DUF4445 domain-containing protein [Spirochaetales bacterium]|nr:DUF4445 domain-containing protein [Spirochaetales bacterium]